MLVAFGPGSTVVPRLWNVCTGQGTAPAGPVGLRNQGGWTIIGELSAEGQNFFKELVGFKVLVLFSSGNFSPKIKFHFRTTMATSACVVYIVSFQGNLGKNPVIPPTGWTVWLHVLSALNLPSLMWWVFCLLLVGSCHTVTGAGLILCHCLCHLPACWTTVFLSIY